MGALLQALILLIVHLYTQLCSNALEIKNFTKVMSPYYPVGDAHGLFGSNNIFLSKNYSGLGQGVLQNMIYLEHITPDGVVHHKQCDNQFDSGKWATNRIGAYYGLVAVSGSLVLAYYKAPLDNDFVDPPTGQNIVYRLIDMKTCEYSETRYPAKFNYSKLLPSDDDAVSYDEEMKIIRFKNKTVSDHFLNLVAYGSPSTVLKSDGSYKIFVHDSEGCTGARCTYTVDSSGTMEKKGVAYLSKEYALSQIQFFQAMAADDYFVVAHDYLENTMKPDYFTLLFARPGESEKILQFNLTGAVFGYDSMERFASVCWVANFNVRDNSSLINCRRYDSMNATIYDSATIGFPFIVKTLKIKQLYEGGLIIIAEECKSDDCKNTSLYHVTLMSAEGEYTKIAEVPDFDRGSEKPDFTILSYEDDNICISLIYSIDLVYSIMKLNRKCFVQKIPGAFRYLK